MGEKWKTLIFDSNYALEYFQNKNSRSYCDMHNFSVLPDLWAHENFCLCFESFLLGSFSNDDGNGGDEACKKCIHILPSNVAAV